ncbi:hypothetical protein BC828DRAFT_413121 [Blastocladiella britannica]|nr:hypothetical protein BC828DRAFT_413121 [Blastocladiella britannica]
MDHNRAVEYASVPWLGDLPDGWELGAAASGQIYFIDHNSKKTTWIDPRTIAYRHQSIQDCGPGDLPYGWERCTTIDGATTSAQSYCVNHHRRQLTLQDPTRSSSRGGDPITYLPRTPPTDPASIAARKRYWAMQADACFGEVQREFVVVSSTPPENAVALSGKEFLPSESHNRSSRARQRSKSRARSGSASSYVADSITPAQPELDTTPKKAFRDRTTASIRPKNAAVRRISPARQPLVVNQ